MYKCSQCSLESNEKSELEKHQLECRHKYLTNFLIHKRSSLSESDVQKELIDSVLTEKKMLSESQSGKEGISDQVAVTKEQEIPVTKEQDIPKVPDIVIDSQLEEANKKSIEKPIIEQPQHQISPKNGIEFTKIMFSTLSLSLRHLSKEYHLDESLQHAKESISHKQTQIVEGIKEFVHDEINEIIHNNEMRLRRNSLKEKENQNLEEGKLEIKREEAEEKEREKEKEKEEMEREREREREIDVHDLEIIEKKMTTKNPNSK